MPVIHDSVGENGGNRPEDVRQVRSLFNTFLPAPLQESDQCTADLIQAIRDFQRSFLPHPDGRIDVGGTTWSKLLERAGQPIQKKLLLLSFDDGPQPESALNSILSTLKAHGIKAEFYVLGSEVDSSPAATKRIVEQGHRLQNHSYSHPDLSKLPKATVLAELRRTQESIRKAAGVTATKIRPPFGAGGWPSNYDPELKAAADSIPLRIVNWDVDTEDWKAPEGIGQNKLTEIQRQLKAQRSKPVLNVLMHVKSGTARDLDQFIVQLKAWGYGFAEP
ncbi:polysaccharide deacetylase family protein [Candidatus Electronema sp. JM]|uniref:polysaccharide deacetylase family protein n=1 Tax=Candidatus Electronema sp. JM TaxID=3401571 RepID=UPI003AA8925A